MSASHFQRCIDAETHIAVSFIGIASLDTNVRNFEMGEIVYHLERSGCGKALEWYDQIGVVAR